MATDAISKSPIVSKVLAKEVLKLRPRYRVLGFGATFILVPLLDHRLAEKRVGKKDTVEPIGPSSFKVILTLLIEQVAIQV